MVELESKESEDNQDASDDDPVTTSDVVESAEAADEITPEVLEDGEKETD